MKKLAVCEGATMMVKLRGVEGIKSSLEDESPRRQAENLADLSPLLR